METAAISRPSQGSTFLKDLISGTVVFLVALPLCLGIALASNAPLFSGIVSGIIGGIVVGVLSGSHTSVSGPAAGLSAIVAAQLATLGSFESFLAAVLMAGIIQLGLGIAKAGNIIDFVPSSVIKGLLAAIGVILILKQLPYVLGHEKIVEAVTTEAAHSPGKHANPFMALFDLAHGKYHLSSLLVGIASLAFLITWDKIKVLKKSLVPAPLLVVVLGVLATYLFPMISPQWEIATKQLVQVPVSNSWQEVLGFIRLPDFSSLLSPATYIAGATIAIVASLETLLNIEAVDSIDSKKRHTPPNRELIAQGIGNIMAGLIGGLPMTSVIVRSSVNINAGGQTKSSAIIHGFLLAGLVIFLPVYLNMIPLSALAAILMVTGYKLVSPKLVLELWKGGPNMFIPFVLTVAAIVMTDLLIGIIFGLLVSVAFILYSNYKRPIDRVLETHVNGEVLHIELANQVSFLNRAALNHVLRDLKPGSHVLIDARHTDYIDPDILAMIKKFRAEASEFRDIHVSLRGFKANYKLHDELRFEDFTSRENRSKLTPESALQLLKEGHERFRGGRAVSRDFRSQLAHSSRKNIPIAVLVSCVDSKVSPELLFDLGASDLQNVSLLGNPSDSPRALSSIEFGCHSGATLVVVLGSSHSMVISAAVHQALAPDSARATPPSAGFDSLVEEIAPLLPPVTPKDFSEMSGEKRQTMIDEVTRAYIQMVAEKIEEASPLLSTQVSAGKIRIAGAFLDIEQGTIEYLGSIRGPDSKRQNTATPAQIG